MLDFAHIEQTIVRQAVQARKSVPTNILEAPELEEGLQLYLQAFFDLDSERSHSFSLVRIPNSAIRNYALDMNLDADQTDELKYFIAEMDGAHLKRLKAKQGGKS